MRRGLESLTEAGNYAGAIRSYDACINDGHLSGVSLARTYRNIGITYRRAKKPIKAVKAYDKAIALHPHGIVDDYINRANAYDEADEFDNAMADYAQALKIDPGFGEIYYNRGVAYEHHHMTDKAKADFIAAYDHGLRTPLLHERLAVYGIVPEKK
jgi:tetratricopeptide (TPR) repeat protein